MFLHLQFYIEKNNKRKKWNPPIIIFITLFKSIITLRGTDNILHNIPHIQYECGNIQEYFVECCKSHKTLSWIWIMLCWFTWLYWLSTIIMRWLDPNQGDSNFLHNLWSSCEILFIIKVKIHVVFRGSYYPPPKPQILLTIEPTIAINLLFWAKLTPNWVKKPNVNHLNYWDDSTTNLQGIIVLPFVIQGGTPHPQLCWSLNLEWLSYIFFWT